MNNFYLALLLEEHRANHGALISVHDFLPDHRASEEPPTPTEDSVREDLHQ